MSYKSFMLLFEYGQKCGQAFGLNVVYTLDKGNKSFIGIIKDRYNRYESIIFI